jgi:putative membrane protein insertion efficiency factor
MRTILISLIKGYQLLISPYLAPSCRYTPSCSSYAQECISVHGSLKGSWLAIKRITRCHPFHAGGYDPVPPALDKKIH